LCDGKNAFGKMGCKDESSFTSFWIERLPLGACKCAVVCEFDL